MKIYLSAVALRDSRGRWIQLQLDSDNAWQNETVALLSAGECGTENNLHIRGSWPGDRARGLRFTVGVPAELNHQDPTQAASPLNVASMFWTWQQGYKFVRLDGPAESWALHLGSTGCASPAPIRPPQAPCRAANRAEIVLDSFQLEQVVSVALDPLQALLTDPQSVSCTGQYAQVAACRQALALFGLDARSGRCASSPCAQRLFHPAGAAP